MIRHQFQLFLKHQLIEILRSRFSNSAIIINILLLIGRLWLLLNIFFLGYFVDKIISDIFPFKEPIEEFITLFFYFVFIDLLLRFFWQKNPVSSIFYYLHLPIKRKTIINFLLFKSIFNFYNLIPLFLILPFIIKVVFVSKSLSYAVILAITLFLFIFANNFINFLIKKYFYLVPIYSIFFIFCLLLIWYLEFENIFSISFLLNLLILKIEKNAVYILIPFAYFSFTYFITYKFLKSRAYLDDFSNGKNTYVHNSKILDFFDIYGQTSNFILLEFKLIWRNKRPKTFVYTSLLLLLFGFKFYSSGVLNYDILIYFGTIVTSIFMIQYGQFIFSWESSYFNFILSKSNLINYITAKYWFFIIINFICFICSCVYSIFGLKILLFNTCLFFFNIGFTSYIILVLGLLNGRKIDFNRSAFFNYEGFSFHQVFIVVISLLSPKLINLGFNYFNLQSYSIYFIGVIGVLGFSYRKLLLSVIFKLFVKRKYILSENFRN